MSLSSSVGLGFPIYKAGVPDEILSVGLSVLTFIDAGSPLGRHFIVRWGKPISLLPPQRETVTRGGRERRWLGRGRIVGCGVSPGVGSELTRGSQVIAH